MATKPEQNLLIRKEVALLTLRSLPVPSEHIGLQLLPFLEVGADDVIFDYAKPTYQEGLAPARAEDAESELAQKDFLYGGTGRASIIDWAQKDHYSASDVQRWEEAQLIQAAEQGVNSLRGQLRLTGGQAEQLQRKYARDDAARKRRLDNRLEWLIMTAFSTGGITYNDGKMSFTVSYGRPAGQHAQAPASTVLWSQATSDPINDILAVKQFMRDTYGIEITRALASAKIQNSFVNSDRFLARVGLPVVGGTPNTPLDINYLGGFTSEQARRIVEEATGVTFLPPYDAVWRSRPIGSSTWTSNRFFPENTVLYLPSTESLAEIADDEIGIGFGKTLTSPHPEGNWDAGFYEWERSTVDPWGVDRGAGIKAFPVVPHMDLTFTSVVL